ncbi:MAG: hypothetical protein GWP59_08810 [Chlamydiales bacterium]|nr:hypothetical protein [Chlamydiales bacterium]NCF71786.1 hypothetical protein [Chlamydiales bacterium]
MRIDSEILSPILFDKTSAELEEQSSATPVTVLAKDNIATTLESSATLENRVIEVQKESAELGDSNVAGFNQQKMEMIDTAISALQSTRDGRMLSSYPLIGNKNVVAVLSELKARVENDSDGLRFQLQNGAELEAAHAKLFASEDGFMQLLASIQDEESRPKGMIQQLAFFNKLKAAAATLENARKDCIA